MFFLVRIHLIQKNLFFFMLRARVGVQFVTGPINYEFTIKRDILFIVLCILHWRACLFDV